MSTEPRVHPRAKNPLEIDQALRDSHPAGLYRSTVVLPAGQGQILMLWRTPTTADAEAYSGKVVTDSHGANVNLAASLAVGPDATLAVGKLAEFPWSLARWVDREVGPFFGGGAEITTEAV